MRHLLLAVSVLAMTGCVTESVYLGSDKPVVEKRINNEDAARTRVSLALKYLASGDSSQAKYNLERAAGFAPKLPEVHYTTAYYYSAVGEVELAKKSYKRAIELDPNDPNTLNNYGVFLCSNGEYDEAESYLLAAIAIPSYIRVAESYENLALCAIENDRFSEASDFLMSSVKHSPLRGSSLLNLSALYYAKSDFHKAENLLERYENAGRVSSRSLLLSYLIQSNMGHLEQANTVATTLEQTYRTSYEALIVRENKLVESEFEKLREQYRKSELRKLQKDLVKDVEQPKIKIVKRKAPSEATSQNQESASTAPDSTKSKVVISAPLIEIAPVENKVVFNEAPLSPTVTAALDREAEAAIVEPPKAKKVKSEVAASNKIADVIADRKELGLIEPPFHVVKKGENLFSISVKYNVKLQKLLEWNALTEGDQVYSGTKVYLNDPNVYHHVIEGDTLFSISVKYNILMKKLVEWNGLETTAYLTPGRKILLVNPKTYSL